MLKRDSRKRVKIMQEKTEINFEELKELVKQMHLEDEFDLMEIGRCSSCCDKCNGGNC